MSGLNALLQARRYAETVSKIINKGIRNATHGEAIMDMQQSPQIPIRTMESENR